MSLVIFARLDLRHRLLEHGELRVHVLREQGHPERGAPRSRCRERVRGARQAPAARIRLEPAGLSARLQLLCREVGENQPTTNQYEDSTQCDDLASQEILRLLDLNLDAQLCLDFKSKEVHLRMCFFSDSPPLFLLVFGCCRIFQMIA